MYMEKVGSKLQFQGDFQSVIRKFSMLQMSSCSILHPIWLYSLDSFDLFASS